MSGGKTRLVFVYSEARTSSYLLYPCHDILRWKAEDFFPFMWIRYKMIQVLFVALKLFLAQQKLLAFSHISMQASRFLDMALSWRSSVSSFKPCRTSRGSFGSASATVLKSTGNSRSPPGFCWSEWFLLLEFFSESTLRMFFVFQSETCIYLKSLSSLDRTSLSLRHALCLLRRSWWRAWISKITAEPCATLQGTVFQEEESLEEGCFRFFDVSGIFLVLESLVFFFVLFDV